MSIRSLLRTALRQFTRLALVLALVALALPVLPARPSLAAATITVTGTGDAINSEGVCTLREAIIAANKNQASGSKPGECRAGSSSGADTIVVPAGTYTLTRNDSGNEDSASTGDLDIKGSLILSPTGPVTITAVSGFSDRIFHILSGSVTITGVTISGGNTGYGGGVYNTATLTLTNSTITGNKATVWGGGLKNAGTLTLTNVTLSGNSSQQDGGGLYNYSNTAVLNNVTLADNVADSDANGSGDGGGVFRRAGTVTIGNLLIAGNRDNSAGAEKPDCSGALNSLGYNLIQNAAGCSFTGSTTGHLTNVNPLIRPLGFYGGNTATHALRAGSPAADAGNPAASGSGACAATDQRGVTRPQGPRCDIGAVENGFVAPPVVIRVVVTAADSIVIGRLAGAPGTNYILDFFASAGCDPAGPRTPLGSGVVTTDAHGDVYFEFDLSAVPEGQFVTALATDPAGNFSGYSACSLAGPGNDSWPRALRLDLAGDPAIASVAHYLDTLGQSRWYKFMVQPNSRLVITLTGLPANYDLTVYKDIAAAYESELIDSQDDLLRLGAEFAPSAFSPSAFSPSAFSPSAFSPSAFSPDAFAPSAFSPSAFSPSAFSPSAFSPSAFSPSAFSPSAFSPSAFSPDAFAPDAFAPSAFSPSAFSPSAFSPSAFSPSAFSPSAFSSAQSRSLIGVSAFEGAAGEGLVLNTWNNTGDFYVRVRGREGAFSLAAPFQLDITLLAGGCAGVSPVTTPPSLAAAARDYQTIILTNLSRTPGDTTVLQARLAALAARPEVRGVIVDVAADARVAAAWAQADAHPQCPYALNEVAYAVKAVIDRYRAVNPLQYIVLIGGDAALPFFRHPDQALLGSEANYVPPVRDETASQASLRLNYVLSQDRYGAGQEVSRREDRLPVAGLAVGRLVETPAEMVTALDAYLSTADGVAPTPTSALVTGYDFLQDAADAVASELSAGLGAPADTLIADRAWSPEDPRSWTADDLRAALLSERHDLVFLAGHFSAASALAADFKTSLITTDVTGSPVNFTNALIYSAGCHSGYNIVNEHGVPLVTFEPDWPQAFARKGATLIAGTGYQYGDTEFIEYSERLYLEFTRELRTGAGPVSVGQALVQAKQAYLADTPQMRGIHEKAYLEATLFGLPMLKIDLPGARLTPPSDASSVAGTAPFAAAPGGALGLAYADVSVAPTLSESVVELTNPDDQTTVEALVVSGADGVLTNPAEPALPLEVRNVTAAGAVLRGVGFRGGAYTDRAGVLPLTGAAVTEIRGVHTPFFTNVFYPVRPWSVNYFGALTGGATRLAVTPAQFVSDPATDRGTLRTFNRMDFRLYYSANVADDLAAGSAAPTLVRVTSTIDGGAVRFRVVVDGNPAAGIQEVWVTYTALSGPWYGTWQSLDLAQSASDSTVWEGALPLGGTPAADVRFIVQAANGVGLVGMATNLGAYYVPGQDGTAGQPTTLALEIPAASGAYGNTGAFAAVLTSNGAPVAGQRVVINLGAQGRAAITDGAGRATVALPLLGLPGDYTVNAFYAGSAAYAPSVADGTFEIARQTTALALTPGASVVGAGADARLTATLTDGAGRPVGEKTVFFALSGPNGAHYAAAITDYAGRARLDGVPLAPGVYTVNVYFGGLIPLPTPITQTDERYTASTAAGALRVNAAPVAGDDAYSVAEDATLTVPAPGVLGNDTDADADALTVALLSGPAHGALTLNANGGFTYTPAVNYAGPDTFTYRIEDGFASDTATVALTVTPVPDTPSAADDAYNATEDTPLTVPAPGVLGNDADADGDPLAVTAYTQPARGSVTVAPNGAFTYTPASGACGPDSFSYTASDGGLTATAAVSLAVACVNDAPVAADDAYTMPGNTTLNVAAPGVLGNDTDVDGGPLAVTAFTQPASGSVTVAADGEFTYTPAPGFAGAVTFAYTVSDGAATDTATVTITVQAVNRPPICAGAASSAPTIWSPDKSFHPVSVVGVTDPDGDPLTITITAIRQDEPTGKTVDGRILGPNSAEVRAERDGNGDGRVYHLFYTASDGRGGVCSDQVRTAIIPHDQGGNIDAIDGGALYDSTVAR